MAGLSRERKQKIWERDGWICHYCGCAVRHFSEIGHQNDTATVDHVTPVSKGGGNGKDNLVTACSFCNRWKGSHHRPKHLRSALAHHWPLPRPPIA
jgi:5-methylcytosine-specific restriction endonuclease McrA